MEWNMSACFATNGKIIERNQELLSCSSMAEIYEIVHNIRGWRILLWEISMEKGDIFWWINDEIR